jgi:uncharacterized cupin superfamily protein
MEITVRKPAPGEVEKLGAKKWPIWTCETSEFDWDYDEKETCLILEGQVTIQAAGQEVSFGPGDLVVFPRGLKCRWKVTRPVRKHYKFG